MDDFGTGYSSLCYLQSFPFDKLKIDQSFTERLDRDEQARKLVSAVIELGRTLKLPTVAEGVETIDQFNFVAEAGCSGVQGFYIGRPNSIGSYADLTERLAEILPAPKMRTLLAGRLPAMPGLALRRLQRASSAKGFAKKPAVPL